MVSPRATPEETTTGWVTVRIDALCSLSGSGRDAATSVTTVPTV
jgi:hypothetical protein